MRPHLFIGIALVGLLATPTLAHEEGSPLPIVIDTDMGLDDAVTLALALQNPDVEIAAIVATDGVTGRETCPLYLECMLDRFNRREIPLYAAVEGGPSRTPPPFRAFAEQALGEVLDAEAERFRRPFSPAAYCVKNHRIVVLALGPLTNLAAALQAAPELKAGIARVVVVGAPTATESWNIRYDPSAWAAVSAAGIPLVCITPADAGRKPAEWQAAEPKTEARTSIGAGFFGQLLAAPQVREHYVVRLGGFHDELAFLYLLKPPLFSKAGSDGSVRPADRAGIIALFTHLLSDGRQGKRRVLFTEDALPDNIFKEDVRRRKAGIIAKNGQTEWLAQVLTNELHQHVGMYSVIGVKMGLRAAELLNAPQHAMRVTSHVVAVTPVSCLNDGLIVSTGCTPGRGLFAHQPDESRGVAATFEYNGRRIELRLREEYRRQARAHIAGLLNKYTLEDPEYWAGVREFGLRIWENWHRRDLFEVNADPPTSE